MGPGLSRVARIRDGLNRETEQRLRDPTMHLLLHLRLRLRKANRRPARMQESGKNQTSHNFSSTPGKRSACPTMTMKYPTRPPHPAGKRGACPTVPRGMGGACPARRVVIHRMGGDAVRSAARGSEGWQADHFHEEPSLAGATT